VKNEVTGGLIKLHKEELGSFLLFISMLKSRRIRWAEHVAGIGEVRNA
jgi:hypothetical protein